MFQCFSKNYFLKMSQILRVILSTVCRYVFLVSCLQKDSKKMVNEKKTKAPPTLLYRSTVKTYFYIEEI